MDHPRFTREPTEAELRSYLESQGVELGVRGIYHCENGSGLVEYIPGDAREIHIGNCGNGNFADPISVVEVSERFVKLQWGTLEIGFVDRRRDDPVVAKFHSAFESFRAQQVRTIEVRSESGAIAVVERLNSLGAVAHVGAAL